MLHYLLFVLAQIFSLQSDSVANLESACHNEIPILKNDRYYQASPLHPLPSLHDIPSDMHERKSFAESFLSHSLFSLDLPPHDGIHKKVPLFQAALFLTLYCYVQDGMPTLRKYRSLYHQIYLYM